MTEILMARDDQVLKPALNLSDVGNPATALANLGGAASDPDLTAIAALTTTGVLARTDAGAYSTRTLTAPAAGFTITAGDGVAGNPTFVLADDLAALEGVSTIGLAVRSAADAWLTRSIVVPAAGLGIADADGVAGNPTLSLTNDLSALEGLGTFGLAIRSAADTWLTRSIAVGSAELTVSNADGVAGNPTLDIGFTLTTTGKNLIDDANTAAQRTTLGLVIGTDVQADLDVPSQAEAEAGTATIERVFTAQRVGQAIAALSSSVVAATQAEQETGTSTTVFVTPGRQQFHQSAVKVSVKFDIAATANASFNVDSVTDTGTGDWLVNITTDFSSVDYAITHGQRDDAANGTLDHLSAGAQSAGSFQIIHNDAAGTLTDAAAADDMHAMAAGDQV